MAAARAPRTVRRFREALDRIPDAGALAAALFAGAGHAFWLDSASAGTPGGAPAHWSVLGVPRRVLRQDRCPGPVLELRAGSPAEPAAPAVVGRSVLEVLERELDEEAREAGGLDDPSVPPAVRELASGWVGYLGYEIRRELDAVRPPHGSLPVRSSGPGSPDALWMRAEDVLLLDAAERDAWAVGSLAWIRRVEAALAAAGRPDSADAAPADALPEARFRAPDPALYQDGVRACLAAIRAGESYEVCLTAEAEIVLEQPLALDAALAVYRRQRRRNPAPHAAFLWFGDGAVLSSSPERFLSLDAAGRCEAKPIKGTVPRGDGPEEDAARAAWLRHDPKSRAENLMIVDLMRNDLSRVCEPASVRVPVLMDVESYASVHQLVSTVEGRLRPGLGVADLLRAAFPGGSMTGAPKARTLEIIDSLERRPRGVYSGALGRIGPRGTDLSVVIRTLVLAADGARTRARVAAGGAVVADSDPAEEYAEMLAKMRAPLPDGWSVEQPVRPGPDRCDPVTTETTTEEEPPC